MSDAITVDTVEVDDKGIAGLNIDTTLNNIVVYGDKNKFDQVALFKDDRFMMDDAGFIRYVKCVEMLVRSSNEYRAYIRYLKEDLDPPLNHCMVYSGITDEMTDIEMHHGPLFTLFDYVEIIIAWHIKLSKPFSSSRIMHIVMNEHRLNNVQIVMLSEAVHKAVHVTGPQATPRFLDYRMAHGDIVTFLHKYYLGLTFGHIGKIKRYFKSYEENVNTNSEFFDEFVTKWQDEILNV